MFNRIFYLYKFKFMRIFTNANSMRFLLLLLLGFLYHNIQAQKNYELINEVNQLEEDKQYLIVCSSTNKAMGELNGDYMNPEPVIIIENRIALDETSNVQPVTLSGKSGAWRLKTSNGYLSSSKAKKIELVTSVTNIPKIAISFNGDNANITFGNYGSIQYNETFPRFLNYTSSVNLLPVQLYKEVDFIQPKVNDPIITPADRREFYDKLSITISSPTDDATIYYTMDDSEPSTSSLKYENPLTINESTKVKAIAVKEGWNNSNVTTATYTKIEPFISLEKLKLESGATETGVDCCFKLNNAIVTYADSEKAYIQDTTAGLFISGRNTLRMGTSLNGIILARLIQRNGIYELITNGTEFNEVTITDNIVIPTQVVTVTELKNNIAQYESMRVKISNATVISAFSNRFGEIEQDNERIALHTTSADISIDLQSTINITGYPCTFNSVNQLNVMLQNDIETIRSGKKTTTLTFEKLSYSVSQGETLIVKATTNSTSPILYSSSDKSLLTVNETTGEVKTGDKAGTAVITATVLENDEYIGATASYTLNITDIPESEKTVAFVAIKDEKYYAMSTESTSENELKAIPVYKIGNKIVNTKEADILWHVDNANGVITTQNGLYLTASETTKTDLTLGSKQCKWTWNQEDSYWGIGSRSFIYNYGGFKNYAISNKGYNGYADTFTQAINVVNGYERTNLKEGDYGTICLPYAVATGDYTGAEFFSIAGVMRSKNKLPEALVLEHVEHLKAGMPYIFRTTTNGNVVVAYNGAPAIKAGMTKGLIGSFEHQDIVEGMYLINSDNKIQLCGIGCWISENRAYINMNDVPEYNEKLGVNQRLIVLEDLDTKVLGIVTDKDEFVDVYTLDGAKVRNLVNVHKATDGLPQGAYIINKKIVIVK